MSKLYTLLLLLITSIMIGQVDHNGNPVFNSIMVGEEVIDNYTLLTSYYTLKNNIENKGSSVYIAAKPTLTQIAEAAVSLPSEFYVILKGKSATYMIMPIYSEGQYFVINAVTGEKKNFPLQLKGEISEQRAKEIVMNNYDPNAILAGKTLFFDNKKYSVISPAESKKALLALIKDQKLNEAEPGNDAVQILSQAEIKEFVLQESKEGGKMDYFTEIKGHEYDPLQIGPGVFSTKIGLALYKWGRTNFELGTNTVDDALAWWALHKGRAANQREREYITMGFNKELEK